MPGYTQNVVNTGALAAALAANIRPPRRGAIVTHGIDTTARPLDLTTLSFGEGADADSQYVFLTLQCAMGGGTIYYNLSPTTQSDLNQATVVAAGSPIAFANAGGFELPPGAIHSFLIDRVLDNFLIVKASAAATLRLFASSGAV